MTARAAALAAALALAATGTAGAAAGTAAPLAVHGVLAPAVIRFADPLVAEVEVDYDPSVVDGASIRVVPDFGPFVETSSPAVTRTRRGDAAVLRLRYSLQCLTAGCLPLKRALELRLPPLAVTAAGQDGTLRAASAWPLLRVVSRLSKQAATGPVTFRHQRVLPAPAYGVSPGGLAAGLVIAAALAALAAAVLLVRALRRRPARLPADGLTALQRALRYTRDAATRPDPADRRRALELLAEAVEDTGSEPLAGRVREAAWVEAPPTPGRSNELADAVEAAERT